MVLSHGKRRCRCSFAVRRMSALEAEQKPQDCVATPSPGDASPGDDGHGKTTQSGHRSTRPSSRAGGRSGRGGRERGTARRRLRRLSGRTRTPPRSAGLDTSQTHRRCKPSIASTATRRSEGGRRADQEDPTRSPPPPRLPPTSRSRQAQALIVAAFCTARVSRPAALPRSALLPLGAVRKAEAGPPPPPGATLATHKNVCTHCSVGCTVIAKVTNGVWTGQEPGWD